MIEHIVLFKWKPEASDLQISEAINSLRALKSKIPGIIDLSCGKNFSERGQGFQHGLVVRFNNRESLKNYLPHPSHQEIFQNLIKPILADIIAIDYEI